MTRKRSPLRVCAGLGALGLAALTAWGVAAGPHGNPVGFVVLGGALAGAMPGALKGARAPGLRAAALLLIGTGLGGVLALLGLASAVREPVAAILLGGLSLRGGAVILPLTAAGLALVCFAPTAARQDSGLPRPPPAAT